MACRAEGPGWAKAWGMKGREAVGSWAGQNLGLRTASTHGTQLGRKPGLVWGHYWLAGRLFGEGLLD